jgi:hypothetical protein
MWTKTNKNGYEVYTHTQVTVAGGGGYSGSSIDFIGAGEDFSVVVTTGSSASLDLDVELHGSADGTTFVNLGDMGTAHGASSSVGYKKSTATAVDMPYWKIVMTRDGGSATAATDVTIVKPVQGNDAVSIAGIGVDPS